jgi:hypothetical protein
MECNNQIKWRNLQSFRSILLNLSEFLKQKWTKSTKSIKLNNVGITKTEDSVHWLIDVTLLTAMLNFVRLVMHYLLNSIRWLLKLFSTKIALRIQQRLISMDRMIKWNMDNNHKEAVLLIWEATIICKEIIRIQIIKEIINKYKEEQEARYSEAADQLKCSKTIIMVSKILTNLLLPKIIL